jgi:glycine/D-amino acid oxidase-like deaminating enzyme/nitrite reductase/ring-hydroxylating ferredoxin subunit
MSTASSMPLWEDAPRPAYPDPLPASGHVETLVVGGGLTGLTTALLLARAGMQVAVLEARSLGAGTTGSSTAKVSLVQGTKMSRILARHPERVARAYLEANREGQAWLRDFCEAHDVAFATRPSGTYAATVEEVASVREEHDALRSLGLPVRWTDGLDVPFDVHGAVVLDDQVQLDPMDVVHALAEQVQLHGGSVHEGHRVRDISTDEPILAELAGGSTITADRLVIATGAPALSGWLWAARTSAARSYLLALEGAAPVPGMFLSAGQPSRSVRTTAPRSGELLLVGGSGHTVGRARSEAAQLDDLRRWAAQHFPGAVERYAWSAQDYSTPDELPMFGTVPGTDRRVHLGTGYDKWGMTNAVAAARAMSADILGGSVSWSEQILDRPASLRSIAGLARQGLLTGAVQAKGLAEAELTGLPSDVPKGTGAVGRSRLRPAAISHGDNGTCAVSVVCTHMGGILSWNDQESSWDCPLHGSRFDSEGEVIEGPATRALPRLESLMRARAHHPAGKGRPSA